MESQGCSRLNVLSNTLLFWKRQDRDWKVTVARTSMQRFGDQMIYPYLSIYIVALGATKIQLGLVNSIGVIIAGLLGPFTGMLIDRSGPKKVYLFGIGMLMTSYLTYALAQSWMLCIVAVGFFWIGNGTSMHSCATICGNCLVNEDRARGMMICESVAAGALGMAGPMIAALLLVQFGGVNANGIRPLFYIPLIIMAFAFILVFTQLSKRKWTTKATTVSNLLKDGIQILKDNRNARKWLAIGALNQLPVGMILPFTLVFAQEVKGASGYILGAMVTCTALTSIIFGFPTGVVADRIGRKKTLYILIPLFWAANLIMVFAPSSAFLLLAGIMQGFYFITGPIAGAIEMELVPPEQMGRWIGINRLVKALFGAGMALIGGIIWDKIGPHYTFVIYVGIDFIFRIPLLISMPETLTYKVDG